MPLKERIDQYRVTCQSFGLTPDSQILSQQKKVSKTELPKELNLAYDYINQALLVPEFCWLICNKKGVITNILARNQDLIQSLEKIGLIKGQEMSLKKIGSHGVSSAIIDNGIRSFANCEHFLNIFKDYVSAGMPCYNLKGNIVGYLGLMAPSHLHPSNLRAMLYLLGNILDTNARMERSADLSKQSRRKLDLLFSKQNAPVMVVTKSGFLRHLNAEASKALALEEIQSDKEIDELANFLPKIKDIVKSAIEEDIKITLKVRRKKIKYICHKTPCYDEGDAFLGAILSFEEESFKSISTSQDYSSKYTFNSIIGNSSPIKRAKALAQQVAGSQVSVLLTGESGTGKEVFAQSIHSESQQKNGPFVSINCSAIPKELAESELFGHVTGAFTGAQRGGRIGKLELANKGTLFLDEIGDMPLDLQVKLLRVLETRKLTRVGGSKEIDIECRVIAATNRNLDQMIENGSFREDLYYRLAVSVIKLPSLKECQSSLPDLFMHYVSYYNDLMGKKVTKFQEGLLENLKRYTWKGNIRELKNAAEFAVMMNSGNQTMNYEHLPGKMRMSIFYQTQEDESTSNYSLNVRPSIYHPAFNELDIIRQTLQHTQGDVEAAAKEMGSSRATLYRKMKKYKLLKRDLN